MRRGSELSAGMPTRQVVSTSYHSVCSEALEEVPSNDTFDYSLSLNSASLSVQVKPCHIQECIAVDCANWPSFPSRGSPLLSNNLRSNGCLHG